jgi:hypothetical protein
MESDREIGRDTGRVIEIGRDRGRFIEIGRVIEI